MQGTILLVLLAASAAALAAEPIAKSATNTDPGGKVGERPYEMAWAERRPERSETVDFEDLTGWTAVGSNGCTAELVRSREEQMHGSFTGKVTYKGKTGASYFELRPPQPIPIVGEPTAAQLWVRGNNWGWYPKPATARTNVYAVVRDAKGEHFVISLGHVNFDYWFLMHATFVSPSGQLTGRIRREGQGDGKIDYPLSFVALRVTNCSDERPAKLFFDSLQFYTPDYKPLAEPKLPPADAPWPTTPDTITPIPKGKVTTSVRRQRAGLAFEAKGGGDAIRWVYEPMAGSLDDLAVEINGRRFRPCVGGGPVFLLGGREIRPGDEGVIAKNLCSDSDQDSVRTHWQLKWGDNFIVYSIRFRPKGKSLQVTFVEGGMFGDKRTEGMTVAFRIGHTQGTPNADLVSVPYLTFGNVGPHIVQWDGVFLSGLLDWYNSDASQLFEEHGKPRPDEVIYNGGSRYLPKTDGTRNPLRERLILTVSSDFQEVLPNIPHPQNPMAHLATGSIWRNIGQPNEDLLKRLKACGVERFICPLHEVGWRDAGESFTFRLRCAPRIGDEKMKQYGEWVKSLGYRFGLYANYTDYAPVNGNWSEDRVCLDSDGNWRGAWPRCVAPKPTWAWQAEADLAPKIAAKFGAVTCYSDVHTAITPWDRTDYDARVPGAGMFRTTWACYARILWNECQAYGGPVFSEGRMHWMSAGLISGNYAQITGPDRWRQPPLVDFDLLHMHPLQCDFGMGMPSMFYERRGGEWHRDKSRTSPWLDRFITSTLAFGHIGYLPMEWGIDGALKSFYMTNAVQQRYALVPVAEIRYLDGEKLLPTSDAIRTGAYKRGQVYVKYASGLELWCNLSFDHDWTVTCGGKTYLLPPTGHLAFKKGELLQFSAIAGGQRVDYVESPDYYYLDTRDAFGLMGPLACKGAAALKPAEKKGEWWAIPCDRCDDLSIRPTPLGLEADAALAAEAFGLDDKPLGPAEVRVSNLGHTIMPVQGAARYRLTVSGTCVAPPPDEDVRRMVPGLGRAARVGIVDTGGRGLQSTRLSVEWLRPDGSSEVVGTDVAPAWIGRGEEHKMLIGIRLPPAARHGERQWFRVRAAGGAPARPAEGVAWFTAIAVAPLDVQLRPAALSPQSPGSRQELLLVFRSNCQGRQHVTVNASSPGLELAPRRATRDLDEGEAATLALAYALPQEPAVVPVTLEFARYPTPVEQAISRGIVGAPPVDLTKPVWTMAVERWLLITKAKTVVADLAKLAPARTGIQFRGKGEEPLGADSGASFRAASNVVGGVAKAGFFCHPPYKGGVGLAFGEFEVALPDEACAFGTLVGFTDGSSTADGCVFSLDVKVGEKWETAGKLQFAELKRWMPFRADLSPFRGKKVALRLVTDVGPADDSNSDWAAWGEPRIVLAGERLAVEVFDKPVLLPIGPPLIPLQGLKAADLETIAEAKVILDGAGVNHAEYTSHVFLNGERIGITPASTSDTAWSEKQGVPVPAEALKTIGPRNVVTIRNPGQDCFKVRGVHLWFRLADGRVGTSRVANGPFCSDAEWLHAEGEGVVLGSDLPAMECDIPAEP